MPSFSHDGFDLHYIDEGAGDPILLIHGFASTLEVNWVAPAWVRWLNDAGYRVIALDNRGHGHSTKSGNAEDYHPELMAADAIALLDHVDVRRAHLMGYSMGARIAAFSALMHPERTGGLVFGGLGMGMVDGVGDWDPIAAALLATDPATITDRRAAAFRDFADRTKSDRMALAACISTSRKLLERDQIAAIDAPALVAVGTLDDIAGDPHQLAALMPKGAGFDIQNRDHMLAVGDRSFKQRVSDFLADNPL